MEELKVTCTVMAMNDDESAHALVFGMTGRGGALLGSEAFSLDRQADEKEWAMKETLQVIIGDESASCGAVESCETLEAPLSFPGKVTHVLYQRYKAGLKGLTILPCERVDHNAARLTEAVIACGVRWQLGKAFLGWVLSENTFCSTMQDCVEWLIENDGKKLPVPEKEGAVRYVKELESYRLRRSRMLGGASVLVAVSAYLCGIESVGAAMEDADIRMLLGRALTEEMLPHLPLERNDNLQYAAHVCSYLEHACAQEKWPEMGENLLARFVSGVLPSIVAYEKAEAVLPNCLCYALSALIMLYAGVRPDSDGVYRIAGENGAVEVLDREDALRAFSRMSCDMASESLAYAVLSDCEIWGCDLREIEGLEDKVTAQLRDMQLLGARGAMKNTQ